LPFIFEGEINCDASLEKLLEKLVKLNYRAAITGAHGRGKSTLLYQLAIALKARGWSTHILKLDSSNRNFEREVWRRLPAFNSHDFILLDGAEQLAMWRWNRFLNLTKSAGGVLITSHRNYLLPTLWECRSSPQLLHALIIYLDSTHDENEAPTEALFKKHRGNLRNALRELYDLQM